MYERIGTKTGKKELVPRYGTGAMKEWYREIVQVIKELVPRDGTRGYNRIGTKKWYRGIIELVPREGMKKLVP